MSSVRVTILTRLGVRSYRLEESALWSVKYLGIDKKRQKQRREYQRLKWRRAAINQIECEIRLWPILVIQCCDQRLVDRSALLQSDFCKGVVRFTQQLMRHPMSQSASTLLLTYKTRPRYEMNKGPTCGALFHFEMEKV